MLHELEVEPDAYGSTVRLGDKWAKAVDGDLLILCVCSEPCKDPASCDDPQDKQCAVCKRTGVGRVKYSWSGPFASIPAALLEYEHEERSRTYGGLFQSMRKAYGKKFDEESAIIVVVYERLA